MAETRLDARMLVPALRQETIFRHWAALAVGDGFELVSDHDPLPMLYGFQAESAGAFTWTYTERGPSVWRIRIGRVDAEIA